MALFEIADLTFTYPEGERPALRGVNLRVEPGEFIVLCGKSGCGKSTLLRHLKTVLTPYGTREGAVNFHGRPLEEAAAREQASKIGYVLQNPENQVVTDKVWHELAYGLESLGYDNKTIRLRVAEMASFFGIQDWFYRSVNELSGGQKQLLNLASVMVMQPEALILDEPTSQLDPIAAADFLGTVRKINREIGTTVLLSEHRLEDALPMADRALVMDGGTVIIDDVPGQIGCRLKQAGHPMLLAMPAPMRIYLALTGDTAAPCPVTVREGKRFLSNYLRAAERGAAREAKPRNKEAPAIKIKDVWFRYEKGGGDILRDLSAEVRPGELYCIVGGNGTGKTTALNVIAGICKPYRGKVEINGADTAKQKFLFRGNLGVLPQDPQCLFVKKTIREDLRKMLPKLGKEEKERRIAEVSELTEIAAFLDMHPYDVSGGEQQRAALAKVLLTDPRILMLDEPTKGMDGFFKQKFAGILEKLKEKGVTIVMVSHDIEFCAEYADRCALFFDGGIVTENEPRAFFAGNSFYTTAANRMCRHLVPDAVTVEEAVALCRQGQ